MGHKLKKKYKRISKQFIDDHTDVYNTINRPGDVIISYRREKTWKQKRDNR